MTDQAMLEAMKALHRAVVGLYNGLLHRINVENVGDIAYQLKECEKQLGVAEQQMERQV